MIRLFYFLLLLSLAMFSCNKNNTDTALRDERIQLLINKKWQLIKLETEALDQNNTIIRTEENYPFEQEWTNDDYQLYRADGKWESNDNQIPDPAGRPVLTGTWSISDDGMKMFSKLDALPEGGWRNIISLTETELKQSEVNEASHWTQTYTYRIIQ